MQLHIQPESQEISQEDECTSPSSSHSLPRHCTLGFLPLPNDEEVTEGIHETGCGFVIAVISIALLSCIRSLASVSMHPDAREVL